MEKDCAAVPQRAFVRVGERQMSYVRWGGSGPTVLLLHGIINCAYAWWQVAPRLVQQGYEVLSLDMPGHGASDLPADHHIDALAAEVSAAIAALDLRGLTLIGHSWGGATALALASGAHPAAHTRLARVALLDPAMAMSTAYGMEALPRYLAQVGLDPAASGPSSRAANPQWHACDVHWRSVALAEVRPAAIEGFFIGSGDWQLSKRVADVAVPLLVLVAEGMSTVIPRDLLVEMGEHVRPVVGQIRRVGGTDHNMFYGAGCAPTLAALRAWMG